MKVPLLEESVAFLEGSNFELIHLHRVKGELVFKAVFAMFFCFPLEMKRFFCSLRFVIFS